MLWPNGSKTRPRISSAFGPRKAPVAGASTFHRGTDFVGFSTIRAIAAGRVERVGTPSGWRGGGTQVWLRHADGSLSRYMHLRSYSVHLGQAVAEGEALGVMGATGNVSGVHLHLEIVPAGASAQVDAVRYIEARLAAPAAAPSGSQVVRDVQHALNVWYNAGLKVDGINGPATEAAILNAQKALKAEGLYTGALDGIWGPQTNTALNRHRDKVNAAKPKPSAPPRIVRLGSRGDLVRKVQDKLKRHYPLYAGKLKVDGVAGPKTIAAIREFQRRSGLKRDGIAGVATLRKLGI